MQERKETSDSILAWKAFVARSFTNVPTTRNYRHLPTVPTRNDSQIVCKTTTLSTSPQLRNKSSQIRLTYFLIVSHFPDGLFYFLHYPLMTRWGPLEKKSSIYFLRVNYDQSQTHIWHNNRYNMQNIIFIKYIHLVCTILPSTRIKIYIFGNYEDHCYVSNCYTVDLEIYV